MTTKALRALIPLAMWIANAGFVAAQQVAINCGGAAFTGSDGTNWSADQYFTGGDLAYTSYSISGAQDLYLYRSARRGLYGNFSYTIPIANGSYTLTLKFAEVEYTNKGQRVFNVTVNGTPVLSHFDILADVPPLTRDDKQFTVSVTNGTLEIDVIGVVGYGLLNAILAQPASGTAPTLSVSPTTLSFAGTAGSPNPSPQTSGVTTSASWTAAPNQSWLTVSPLSGSGNASLSIGVNLSGVAAGNYAGAVTVTASGATGSPQTITVSLSVAAPSTTPGVSVSPGSLSFSAITGGSSPAAQNLSISNSGGGTLNWAASKTQAWLVLGATSGTGAASLSVQAVTGSLAPGTYTDTVTISAADATPASQAVGVTFTLSPASTSAPVLSINCGGAAFTAVDGTNWSADEYYSGGDLLYTGYLITGTQDLPLYRSARRGLYGDFSYSIPLANGSYLLKLRFAELAYTAAGQRVFNVTANGSAILTNFDILKEVPPLTVDDKTFPVTVTSGTLQIAFAGVVNRGLINGIQILPAGSVSGPVLTLSSTAIGFNGTASGSNPAAQPVTISNSGTGTLSWTASSNQNWLTVSPGSGSGNGMISIGANLTGLGAGTYTGAVTVTAAGASSSPQSIAATLTVAPPSTPALSVTPGSLSFSATAGSANPTAQNINISNTGSGSLNWTASKTQAWLTLSSTSGSGAASITVQPLIAGLGAGGYTDTVTISAPGATPSSGSVGVTFTVNATAPTINSFTASQSIITAGQSVTFSWSTSNATSVSLNQGIGTVAVTGSTTVSPSATAFYTLTASSAAGTTANSILITVGTGTTSGGNSANTDQWIPNSNPPQTYNPNGGPVLYNGIQLPAAWPPLNGPSQTYTVPPYIQNPPAVIPIDLGRQLFVDDFLIANTNLTRVQHQPVLYSGNPVLTPGGWDRINDAFPYSDGAWFDPADQTYKMWYFGGLDGNQMCYAYSSDGVNWIKPNIADAAIAGTNIVLLIGGGRDTTTVWMDLHDVPSRKFKVFVTYSNGPNGAYVFNIYFSPDGIHWTGPQAAKPLALSDRTTALYNPFRGVWIDSARDGACFPAAPTRAAYCPQRERYYSESPDLQTWRPADPSTAYWTGTDERDPPYPGTTTVPELYNLDGVAYESVMVGLFSWYYPSNPDLVELGVGFSRDGFNWNRPTRGGGPSNAFIPATDTPGTWNGYNTQSAGGGFLVVGSQLYFYFSGRNFPHSQDASATRQTGLATLRRDGFYSMEAAATQGTLLTRAVKFSGSHFFVNVADPSGQLQVEVLDSNGNVIPAFGKANSSVITADTTSLEVTWNGANVASLAGQTVQLRFYLTNGALYSFWVSKSASGASSGYVGANGPGFTTDTDTVGH
jgi:Malectin domain/Viral BACON domain